MYLTLLQFNLQCIHRSIWMIASSNNWLAQIHRKQFNSKQLAMIRATAIPNGKMTVTDDTYNVILVKRFYGDREMTANGISFNSLRNILCSSRLATIQYHKPPFATHFQVTSMHQLCTRQHITQPFSHHVRILQKQIFISVQSHKLKQTLPIN